MKQGSAEQQNSEEDARRSFKLLGCFSLCSRFVFENYKSFVISRAEFGPVQKLLASETGRGE